MVRPLLACLLLCTTSLFSQTEEAFHIKVQKNEFRLSVYKGDSLVKRYEIATGRNSGNKQRRGDYRTPEGSFAVVQIQSSSAWTHDFHDGKGEVRGAYGPWFIRLGSGKTEMPWRGIGIHGTHDPSSIGASITEGCIRMRNEELVELKKIVRLGTPVTITP